MEENFNGLFNYKIIYSKNRRKTIGFKVTNNTLIIKTPKNISKDFLLNLIEKRKNWTIERINIKNNKKELIDNNKILFMGKEIEISINKNSLLNNGGYCEFSSDKLLVYISSNYNEEMLNHIIKKWYKDQCSKTMSERVKEFSIKYNLMYKTITIKEQKTVWGTCNINNDLTFNWKIMFFDLEVIDYLIVHELVHTIHKNHSKNYWDAVERIIPNHKELRNRLKKVVSL